MPQMVPARPCGFHLSLEYSWVNFEHLKNALIVCFDTANVTKRRGNRVWGHGEDCNGEEAVRRAGGEEGLLGLAAGSEGGWASQGR